VNKIIVLDARASKEIKKFPKQVRSKVKAYLNILAETGRLSKPFAKKLTGKQNLYEIRIKYNGAWRILYAYFEETKIIVLSGFHKKTQKIPQNEILKAQKRMQEYI